MATYKRVSVSEREPEGAVEDVGGRRGSTLSDQYTRKALISVWDEAVQNTVSV